MSVKLLIEHHLEFLSLPGGCAGPSESTIVKNPHCRKSHVAVHVHDTLEVVLMVVMSSKTRFRCIFPN